MRGLGGKRGLAHAAHGVQHDAASRAESALQLVRAPAPARGSHTAAAVGTAGFLGQRRRVRNPPTAAGILGIGTADQPGEHRGVFGVTGRIGEVHPEQDIQFVGSVERLELDRDEPVALGIELVVLLDLPLQPIWSSVLSASRRRP